MDFKLELNGIVFQIDEPKTRNSYTNQELMLYIPDIQKDQFSNYFTIEWNQNGIEKVKEAKIQKGDEVKITAYMQGRKWKKPEEEDHFKSFISLKGFSIEKATDDSNASSEVLSPFPILDKEPEETKNDLPF
jgi:hypothetical protein